MSNFAVFSESIYVVVVSENYVGLVKQPNVSVFLLQQCLSA